MNGDSVWYDDLRILWKRPNEIIPTIEQTDAERVNSIVRLVLYCSIAITIIRQEAKVLAFGGALVAVVSLCHASGLRRDRDESYANIRPTSLKKSKQACSMSSRDNPFSNATVGELVKNPTRPPACSFDANDRDIRANFNAGLFRNLDDVYETENSRRQFVTQPVTTSAPDTIAFGEFLFGNRPTCKESTNECRPYFAARS